MPWREKSVVEQRRELVEMASKGAVSVAELARRFSVSRQTVYKWLARFEAGGAAGLADRSRRPRGSPNRTSAEVEQLVCAAADEFPVWGGRKLRGFLLRQGHSDVPAASTITEILRRNGRLNDSDRQRRAYGRFERSYPNELWAIDFKGWLPLADGSRCHPFGVIDDHSRFSLCLKACSNQQTQTVKTHLTSTFERYGLPESMLMDNGSPWGDRWGQPWTPLTVWLCDLGIQVIHSRPFHPQTNGKRERLHQTVELEVHGQQPVWHNLNEIQTAYDKWEPKYNYLRPHDSLGETVVPGDRYQPSPRSIPTDIKEPDYPDHWHLRTVWTTSPEIRFRNQRFKIGKPFRGRTVAIAPTPTPGKYEIHYRHHIIRTIELSTMSPNTCQPSPQP